MDERVSKLIAEIHDQPSPEEAFSRWMFVDIFILDGLMMLFTIVFLILRDIIIVLMIGFGAVAFGSAYLMLKDKAKNARIGGRDFLDSQTLIGDYEITEQIAIRAYDYVILPQETLDGKKIMYSRVDVDDTLGTLRVARIRVGSSSELRPQVVDNLVRLRLGELKDMELDKRRKAKDLKDEEDEGIEKDWLGRKKKSNIRKLPTELVGLGRPIGVSERIPESEDVLGDIKVDENIEFKDEVFEDEVFEDEEFEGEELDAEAEDEED